MSSFHLSSLPVILDRSQPTSTATLSGTARPGLARPGTAIPGTSSALSAVARPTITTRPAVSQASPAPLHRNFVEMSQHLRQNQPSAQDGAALNAPAYSSNLGLAFAAALQGRKEPVSAASATPAVHRMAATPVAPAAHAAPQTAKPAPATAATAAPAMAAPDIELLDKDIPAAPFGRAGSLNQHQISCLYLYTQEQQRKDLTELEVKLVYTDAQRQEYITKKKAYIYARTIDQTAIYSLLTILPYNSLSYKLQQLLNETGVTNAAPAQSHTAVNGGAASGAKAEPLQIEFEVRVAESSLGRACFTLLKNEEQEQYFTYLERWLSFFDYMITCNTVNEFSNVYQIKFNEVNNVIANFCTDDFQTTRSRILEIAESSTATLQRLSRKLRKSLVNTRKLMRIERVNEMDGKCLEYLLRLEGNTIHEKAQKNKLRIMGLAKEETHNLLENRVLKDFLARCIVKANEYTRQLEEAANHNKQLFNSSMLKQMKVFKQRCQELNDNPMLAAVPRQTILPKPNFVLQKDPDYKHIWQKYLDLIHEKRDLDHTLYCQQNLFQDISDTLLNAALCHLNQRRHIECGTGSFTFTTITQSYLNVLNQQLNGHRIKMGCNAGPFFIKSGNTPGYVLRIITSGSDELVMNEVTSQLHRQQQYFSYARLPQVLPTAPTYLLFTQTLSVNRLGSTPHQVLVPFYSIHQMLDSPEELEDLKAQVLSELSPLAAKCPQKLGLIVSTNYDVAADRTTFEQHPKDNHCFATTVSSRPNTWINSMNSLEDTISNIILEILNG